MNPDDLQALLAATRPEPPAALRARVLAAAYAVEIPPPWWARVRTWSAAAAVLLCLNWLLMAPPAAPGLPEPAPRFVSIDPEINAALSPIQLAALNRPAPAPRGRATTPLTPIEEILR